MRPGQHNNNNNKNRNRNRNNNRRNNSGGGGGGHQGGSGANRVYDSNGPDVKLRGTAQTVAEKYMQLARDAASSGDTVMAESYYQFGDHYYRVWLAAQPVGQPLQFSRRMAEEEYEDEGGGDATDGDDEQSQGDSPVAEASENGDGMAVNDDSNGDGQQAEGQQNRNNNRPREFRDNNNRDNNNRDNNNRDNNNRDGQRFRQRWPRRNDRFTADGNGQAAGAAPEAAPENGERVERFEPAPERTERPERPERPERQERVERVVVQDMPSQDAGNWEAPSFLTRPTPVISAEVETSPVDAPVVRAPRGRRPKVAVEADVPEVPPQGE